jgi:hypothetical protein
MDIDTYNPLSSRSERPERVNGRRYRINYLHGFLEKHLTMRSFTSFLDRIANWKTLLFLLVLYVSFPAYWLKNAEATMNRLAGKTIGPIDLTFGFNPTRTLAMVADYGPAGRAYYTSVELTTDLIYPIVYSMLSESS